MKKKISLNLLQLILIVSIPCFVMSIVSGSIVYTNLHSTGKVTTTNNKYVNQFINTYNKLLSDYYEDLDENKLVDSAISGMLSYTGDDYTIYMDEDATESLNDRLDGTYDGIGISIGINTDNNIYISKVYDDTPASEAGLLVNDIITSINDESVLGKTTNEASDIIKKNKDKKVKLVINRNGEELSFDLERKTLIVPVVTSSIKEVNGKKIGYIYLEAFSSTVDTQVEANLIKMEKDGIDSLIIDLRGNTGGYLTSCTNIINMFLKKNKLMYTVKSKNKSEDFKDDTDESKNYPVVVLINANSASASEILASALKYSYGATLVGTKSYGKGKVQTTGELDDGTMIKYTSAKWYTANGDCIDKKGIEPDIKVELNDDYINNPVEENDNQLQEAIKKLSE